MTQMSLERTNTGWEQNIHYLVKAFFILYRVNWRGDEFLVGTVMTVPLILSPHGSRDSNISNERKRDLNSRKQDNCMWKSSKAYYEIRNEFYQNNKFHVNNIQQINQVKHHFTFDNVPVHEVHCNISQNLYKTCKKSVYFVTCGKKWRLLVGCYKLQHLHCQFSLVRVEQMLILYLCYCFEQHWNRSFIYYDDGTWHNTDLFIVKWCVYTCATLSKT